MAKDFSWLHHSYYSCLNGKLPILLHINIPFLGMFSTFTKSRKVGYDFLVWTRVKSTEDYDTMKSNIRNYMKMGLSGKLTLDQWITPAFSYAWPRDKEKTKVGERGNVANGHGDKPGKRKIEKQFRLERESLDRQLRWIHGFAIHVLKSDKIRFEQGLGGTNER